MSDPNTENSSHDQNVDSEVHFSDEELSQFRQSDIVAGRMIVSLMTAIFAVGLVLYTIVLISVL